MKLFILILYASLFWGNISLAQRNANIPPGTTRINDTLYADKTEMTNVGWREYLYYLLDIRKDTQAYYAALPDTTIWRDDDEKSQLAEYFFRHPGFNNYPVTGVTYEQVIAYCKWRTYAANQAAYFKENKIKNFHDHLKDSVPIRFFYRLPTQQEWELIAAGKYEIEKYPYGFDDTVVKWKKRYIARFNYKNAEPLDAIEMRFTYTTNANSYFPNSYKLYNTIGNVAEMVNERGIAKGGSFMHNLEDCKIINNQVYTKHEKWLGFRCVAILVKEE